ncbi:MAG: MFS transporter [Clostridia bacterium]|nr:MFS transporter [Clostridia bacterium]
MTNDERKNFYMNRNIKLSPSLIALTWDVIFIWTISTLYFTSVKGLTNAQVISLDSILMLFGCLFCVPVGKIFQNISPIKATRIGLLGYAGYLLISMFGPAGNFFVFVLAQPFLAFGYVVMSVKINSVLNDSLAVVKRDKDYQRVYGKGLSLYYIIECVGAIVITYVYNWKPDMVFVCSLFMVLLTMFLTFFYKEPKKFMEKNVEINSKVESAKTIKKPDSFFKILKSSFFVLLLVYAFFVRGVLSITGSAFKIYLNFLIGEGAIPIWAYGYMYAGSRIVNALSSKYQFKFNLKFGVRSLLLFNVLIIISFVGAGVLFLINPTSIWSIVIIIILSYIMCAIRTPNQIFLNNYMQVCTSKKNIERAYSIRTMVEYLGYALISSIYAGLLAGFNDNYGITSLVYIGIFTIPLIVSLILFIKVLCKKYAQKYTVIKDEYTKD